MDRPFSGRAGDRVLLAATIERVISKPGRPQIVAVDIDGCCRASIPTSMIANVTSESIRAGDQVRFRGNRQHGYDGEPWIYAEVLFVENAKSATGLSNPEPGQARALLKPRGFSNRPLICVSDLQRASGDPEADQPAEEGGDA